MKRKLCKNCEEFVKKFKPWNERKVPDLATIRVCECKECRMSYHIYKGMVWPIPMATHKEIKEIKKYIGKFGE